MSILLLYDRSADSDSLRKEAEAVLKHWPGGHGPTLQCAAIAEVLQNHTKVKEARVIWLHTNPSNDSELFDLLADNPVPTLISCPNDDLALGQTLQDGMVSCPSSIEPTLCCAMLAALYSQATLIASLRTEVRLMQLNQSGIANQIDKIDEELRLAAQLQREFLPTQLPQTDSLVFDVMWRPAGYVSGDIYDVEQLDEDHIGMFLADAVGHGVPAALMTVYIKRSLVTKRPDPDTPHGYHIIEPAKALEQLNFDMIAHQSDKVRFATAVYVVINCRTLVAQVSRAGHPFPMLLRADGSTEMLEPGGGLLGVFPEETYDQLEIQLKPNDRLLLYSDGFEMAFPDDAPKEKKRIANDNYTEQFQKLREGSLSDGLAELGKLLDVQAGSLNQRDDLTVLGVTTLAPAHCDTDAQLQHEAA